MRQVRYLASLDPTTAAASQPAIDAMTALAEHVDSPGLSVETPDDELPFAAPAPYWLDLRGYDPVATAAALHKPMLICQVGRDYQAAVADDLTRWQAGLDGRPDVAIKRLPGRQPLLPARHRPFQPRRARHPTAPRRRTRRRHQRLADRQRSLSVTRPRSPPDKCAGVLSPQAGRPCRPCRSAERRRRPGGRWRTGRRSLQ